MSDNIKSILARIEFLEDIIYRLYTGDKELSTGMVNELIRMIDERNPDYFKGVEKDGE